jgi:hypothetical protein
MGNLFYLIRGAGEIASAETFDRAARLVAQGWQLTTRAEYLARWRLNDRRDVPLKERTV